MTRKDYVKFAEVFARAYATYADIDDGDKWEIIYEEVYCPIVEILVEDNPRFDRSRFAFAVGIGEPLKAYDA